MTTKQRLKFGLNNDSSRYEMKNRMHSFKAEFWAKLESRNQNFPRQQFTESTYGDTDSIWSRSLTAKETYNTIHAENPHLPVSLRCKICHEPLEHLHRCLFDSKPTSSINVLVGQLYYNFGRFHTDSLQQVTEHRTLQTIARNLWTQAQGKRN